MADDDLRAAEEGRRIPRRSVRSDDLAPFLVLARPVVDEGVAPRAPAQRCGDSRYAIDEIDRGGVMEHPAIVESRRRSGDEDLARVDRRDGLEPVRHRPEMHS